MKNCFSKLLVILPLFLTLFVFHFAIAGTVNYTYDDAGRLTKVEYDDGSTIEYTYDNAGNLLQRKITVPEPDIAVDPVSHDFGEIKVVSQSRGPGIPIVPIQSRYHVFQRLWNKTKLCRGH